MIARIEIMTEGEVRLEISRFINELKFKYSDMGSDANKDLENDLKKINELALLKFLNTALSLKPGNKKLVDEKDLQEYLSTNFTDEELENLMKNAVMEAYGFYDKKLNSK